MDVQNHRLEIIPLGGGQEVGRSCILLQFKGRRILLGLNGDMNRLISICSLRLKMVIRDETFNIDDKNLIHFITIKLTSKHHQNIAQLCYHIFKLSQIIINFTHHL